MDMKLAKLLTALVVALAGIATLYQYGTAVPGLEWLRFDAITSRLTVGAPPSPRPVATADQPATAPIDGGKSKRSANGSAPANGAAPSSGGGGRRGGSDGPAPVVVAPASIDDVPVYLRGVGSARSPQTVTVKPQVDGKLTRVAFKEGQDVKKGDLLAEIDPVTYQAAYDQAVGKRALTEVTLKNAKVDLDRYLSTGPGVTAQKTTDTQRALVLQTEAQLRQDTAAVENAKAILDYTKITSPLDGRTGQRLVDEGNIVHASDAGLVTIAQIKPIQIQFTLPQQQLAQVMEAMKSGPVSVEAMDGDDRTMLDQGALSFVDNAVDPTTGTVRMKAELPNDRLQLWPGQFANVRVKVQTLKGAITAPTAAIQRGPQGTFVYVLNESGDGGKSTVAVRLVTVAQQDDRVSVITNGIAGGDKLVTSGFARLKDAAEVTVTRTEAAPAPFAPPKPAGATPDRTSAVPETGSTITTGSTAEKPRPDRVGRADASTGTDEAKPRVRGKRGKTESAVQ